MGRLDDSVALVTGGASGIGAAACRALAGEGADVIVVDIDEPSAAAVAAEIGGTTVIGSVSDASLWEEVVREVEAKGRLDVVHLNAGLYGYSGPIDDAPLDVVEATIDVNIVGVVFGVIACVPLIEASGGGSIVVTASVAGLVPFEGNPLYSLTKQAVASFVVAQAPALAGRRVSLDAVCPGIVDTPMTADALDGLDAAELGIDLIDPRDVVAAMIDLATTDGTGRCVAVQAGLPTVEWTHPTWRDLLDVARGH